jgi:putative nucleotidyltransferase with HDIG domain
MDAVRGGEGEALVANSRLRVAKTPDVRDLYVSAAIAACFVAVAGGLLAVAESPFPTHLGVIPVLIAAYVLAGRVQFEVGTGVVVPTQLVLVPMLFVLPPAWAPISVAVALVIDHLIDVVRGRAPLARTAQTVANGWHSVGPALVLVLAGSDTVSVSQWPLYVAALLAQFAFDFAAMAARDWLVLGVPPRAELAFLPTIYLVDSALAPVGLLAAIAAEENPYAFVLAMPLLVILAFFGRERRTRIDQALELSNAYRGTAFLLGDVVEADDAYTGAHSRDVVSLVGEVARQMGLGPSDVRVAELGALLHDVGKIRVPKEIINKPGPLSPSEREIVNRHTVEGQAMLEQVGGLLAEVGTVVRSHHEWWDGTGYPDNLAGDAIPLVSRIIAVCDAFNAMTTSRPYRRALPVQTALSELRSKAGTQFDPAVVEALFRAIAQGTCSDLTPVSVAA